MAYKQLKLWFDKELAVLLSDKIKTVSLNFEEAAFIKNIDQKVDQLELKDRVETIADELYNALNHNYEYGISILSQIFGPENDKETGMFTDFYWIMPIAKYVEKYGLDHFDLSMSAIEEITKRNTGEYTIRPFFTSHYEQTLSQMKAWSIHPNRHVRRLSCEGLRPRLPWAKKLDVFIEDPQPVFPILNSLKDDSSKYVQKSVANCVNDILKDNFDIGKTLIESWCESDMSKARRWIIKHALRNLLKADDDWAKRMVNS